MVSWRASRATVLRGLREYSEALFLAFVFAVILRSFVVGTYRIPTLSMAPTLLPGEFVFSSKLAYGFHLPFSDIFFLWSQPKRGDVVVFDCPKKEEQLCVKRVIGLPGDRVSLRDGRLTLNNEEAQYQKIHFSDPGYRFERSEPAREIILYHDRPVLLPQSEAQEVFGPLIVPPGHIFVLGDYRQGADDSRMWGPVPMDSVRGKIFLIWLSLNWNEIPESDRNWPQFRWARVMQWL